MLYRCSLTCRVVRQFESLYSSLAIKTRIEVICPQLHFSLSDTQLPMFLRLVELVYALYSNQLQQNTTAQDPLNQVLPEGEEHLSLAGDHEGAESWSSWMWSLGSSLMEWEEGEFSATSRHHKLNSVFHFGIYADVVTWVFKVIKLFN